MRQHRILIIRPDRIGDVVLTTGLAREIKKTFPGAYVSVLVQTSTEPLLRNNPNIDSILTDDPAGKDSGKKGFWNQVSMLRSHRFTIGLMPLPRERHAWMMLLAGIPKRVGVGTKLYQVITGMKSVSRNKYIPLRHEADYIMDLGRKIGITTDNISPEIFVTEEENAAARSAFEKHGFDLSQPIVGINPGSNRSVPNWDIRKYVSLVEALAPAHQLFLNVGPKNSGLKEYFSKFDNVLLFDSNDLRELIGMCRQLAVLVSSSTGTMHIAAALGIPTVSMFCPLPACSPALWGPLGNHSKIFLPPDGYCQFRCPGNPKICPLEEIPIEPVLHHIREAVNRPK